MLASPVRGWKKQDVYSGLCDRGRTHFFYCFEVDMSVAVFEALNARINQLESKLKEYEQRQAEADEKTQNELFLEFLAIVHELMPLVNQALMTGLKDGDLHSR